MDPTDISNPVHPFSVWNPTNPASPFNPNNNNGGSTTQPHSTLEWIIFSTVLGLYLVFLLVWGWNEIKNDQR